MTKLKFLEHFAEIVEEPAGSLNGNEKLSDIGGWDSVAMVSFIALGDQHFQKSLSPRQIAGCDTVNDLGKLLGVAD